MRCCPFSIFTQCTHDRQRYGGIENEREFGSRGKVGSTGPEGKGGFKASREVHKFMGRLWQQAAGTKSIEIYDAGFLQNAGRCEVILTMLKSGDLRDSGATCIAKLWHVQAVSCLQMFRVHQDQKIQCIPGLLILARRHFLKLLVLLLLQHLILFLVVEVSSCPVEWARPMKEVVATSAIS